MMTQVCVSLCRWCHEVASLLLLFSLMAGQGQDFDDGGGKQQCNSQEDMFEGE